MENERKSLIMLLLTEASGCIVACRQFWSGDSQHSSLQHCSTALHIFYTILQLLESTQRLYAAIQAAEWPSSVQLILRWSKLISCMLYKRTNPGTNTADGDDP